MIYVTENQFANLKLNLTSMLDRLGTGMKSRKLDESVAKILGFKNFNTYLAIGKIETYYKKHLDIVASRISDGDLCGKLDFDEKSFLWNLCIDGMPLISDAEYFNKNLKIPKTPYELVTNKQLNELIDSKSNDKDWKSNIATSLRHGNIDGVIDIDGFESDWGLSGGIFNVPYSDDRYFESAEIALVAENISYLFKDQIGNKIEELTLIFCGGDDYAYLSDIGFDFLKSFDTPVIKKYSIGMFKDCPTDVAESDTLQGIFLEKHRILNRLESDGNIAGHFGARFTIDLTVTSETGETLLNAGIGTEFDEERLDIFPPFDCNKFNMALDSNGPYYCDLDFGPSSWQCPFVAPSLEVAKKAMDFISSGWASCKGVNCVNVNGASSYIKGNTNTYEDKLIEDGLIPHEKYPYDEFDKSYGNIKFYSS